MDTANATELSDEFQSAFSGILPDLYQLLQIYHVSSSLEIHLSNLVDYSTSSTGSCFCNGVIQRPCKCDGITTIPPELGLDDDKAQRLLTELDSQLSTILPGLSQSAQQMDESFEIHFLIDPAAANSGQPVVCQWTCDNILKCSDS
jgi:hypothetical protein